MWKRRGICSGQNLTCVWITTYVQWQEYEPTFENSFQSLCHILSGVSSTVLKLYRLPEMFRLQSKSPATWQWLFPLATDQDGFRRSRRRLSTLISLLILDSVTALMLIKQLRITMGNPPACQSQLSRLNPGVIRISKFKPNSWRFVSIHIYSIASIRYKYLLFQRERGRFSNSQSIYNTMLVGCLC